MSKKNQRKREWENIQFDIGYSTRNRKIFEIENRTKKKRDNQKRRQKQ